MSAAAGHLRLGWPLVLNSVQVRLYNFESRFNELNTISEIPMNEYFEYFGPDYQLDVKSSNMEDMNTPTYLTRIKSIVMDHLRQVGGPPSVQMQGTLMRLQPTSYV